MIQDKELLLKDLCARLPYGVICHYNTIVPMVGKVKSYDKLRAISEFDNKPCFQFNCNRDIFDFDNIKPYLFPLSSLTEEQRNDISKLLIDTQNTFSPYGEINTKGCDNLFVCSVKQSNALINYCLMHHLDINGLIEKGLAIDATGLNIY